MHPITPDSPRFCPSCLCATEAGATPAGEPVYTCRNERCRRTIAAAVAQNALLTGAEVFEHRRRHAAQQPRIPISVGQRVQVATFSDDVWGEVISISNDGFMFLGDGWAIPLSYSFKAVLATDPLFPPSYLARLFWRNRAAFVAELATLTPEQLERQAALHVRYLAQHAPAALEAGRLLLVWRRMLDGLTPELPPALARVA